MPTTTATKDAIQVALQKALKAVEAARKAGYEDTRTTTTPMTDYLDQAFHSITSAQTWYKELLQEEKANERPDPPSKTKTKAAVKEDCHICGNDIEPGDVAVCGGCDKPTYPECMGDDGICKDCELEG